MRYVGGKYKLSKHLKPFLIADRQVNQAYVEPFVGGFNMMEHIDGERFAFDTHFYLIELYKAIQNGWEPPAEVTVDYYKAIKNNMGYYDPYLVGFVGFGCSFAGKWFGGYARGDNRNFADESRRNLLKQKPKIEHVNIVQSTYNGIYIPDNSIIYCDPPYAKSQGYSVGEFNSSEFWNWCLTMSDHGHTVFVSEYEAPQNERIVSIWSKEVASSLDLNTGGKRNIEKLWKIY